MTPPTSEPTTYQAWFTRRPSVALVGILVLFTLITALRVSVGSDAQAGITLFYVIPISLAALAWGRFAGMVAVGVALVLLVLWVLVADVELSLLGWGARVVPIVFSGLLLGDASDRLRRTEEANRGRLERELLHRQAVEVNDSLLQGMSAAKWSIEAGNYELGLKTLEETIEAGQALVSELIRESEMRPGEEHMG